MKKVIPQIFIAVVIVTLFWIIRPTFLEQLSGTFRSHTLPQDYIKLEQFLSNKKQFSRTLWVPTTQVFGFYSPVHPEVNAYDFFHVASPSGVLDMLQKSDAEKKLQDVGIAYVIVPFDSEGVIFLKDRKYDNASYEEMVKSVANISWLTQVPGFGKVHIFEVPHPKDHFWSSNTNLHISYHMISPVEYTLGVENAKVGDRIVFAESFDPLWQATINGKVIPSVVDNNLNSFILPKDGSYSLKVFYKPQEWVNIGLWISIVTLGFIAVIFLKLASGRKK